MEDTDGMVMASSASNPGNLPGSDEEINQTQQNV